MSKKNIIDETTESLLATFFKRNQIRSVKVEKGEGITRSTEISDVEMFLIKQQNDPHKDYSVEFKLQRQCADIFRYIRAIDTEPAFVVSLGDEVSQENAVLVNRSLRDFIETIAERVKSALKEETVQNIRYVGNTFILHNSVKFKVLSDEGGGRLNIEVLTKDKPLDALLTASGLLDGLYLGSIKLLDN